MRRLLALLLYLLASLPTFAYDGDRQLCDGTYAAAQEMLDAAYGKYGTLYTGGAAYDFYGDNGVGPTVDLWRLWQGLPDLRFRDAATFDWFDTDWGVGDVTRVGDRPEDFAMLLRIANRRQATGLEENYRYITALYLDKLVDAGSGPGWWLAPTPRDGTPRQQLVIQSAAPGSLMEWLLVLQADSDTPDAVAWVHDSRWTRSRSLPSENGWATSVSTPWDLKTPTELLQDLVAKRVGAEPGLAWQAAALVTDGLPRTYRYESVPPLDCAASPAEYALWSVATYEYLKRQGDNADLGLLPFLPKRMRMNALANLAMVAVHRTGSGRQSLSAATVLDVVAAHSPSDDFSSWLFVGRAWTASTVDMLLHFHQGTRLRDGSIDTLNMLAVDDLATFVDQATLPNDQNRALLTVVASRAFALGRLDMARRYLIRLQDMMPDYAAQIADALNGPGDDDVQIARAILALPAPTVWLRDYHRGEFGYSAWGKASCCFRDIDLPLRYASAAVLNRDLRQWMAAPDDPWWRPVIRRANERGRVYDDRRARPFIPDDWQGDEGFPFLRLIAWNEISQLDVCHGLSNRLSEVLVHWADQASDNWIKRLLVDEDLVSDTLRRVVDLNKLSPGALVDGQPAGQRAKALLETRFAGTDAAQATRYWYFEDKGCRK